ncbi:hypothetical protein M8C21_001978 [Ambrosia artemisiifolia]|uniref:Uncharacterized protein n=1 Tax=Ambrosia artemisiifolia TaxID=4212 RepID=A0AAD5BV65_AMBAR|nr:hypothetical protein M8C21_001978 [Ambrosia artemisiifolia]
MIFVCWRTHVACCARRLIILIFIKCTGLTAMFRCLEKLIMILPDNIIMLVSKNNLMLKEMLLMLIRFIGVSNETPYGVMKFLQAAENNSAYPRMLSVQVDICCFDKTGTMISDDMFSGVGGLSDDIDLEMDTKKVPTRTLEILGSCHALVFVDNKLDIDSALIT